MAATTRAKRPEIKIALKDFNSLTIYCKGVAGTTPTKIIGDLVSEFLDKEEVKKIIDDNSVSDAKRKQIEKKKAQIEKLKAELADLVKED